MRTGNGRLILKDGSYYQGEFKNGEINGIGTKFNHALNSEYKGEFVNGHYHGKGVLKTGNNFVYDGYFFENVRHGTGELREINVGRYYKGEWHQNKRHGYGLQQFSDGSVYEGDWIQDRRQGHGEIKYLDSTEYEVLDWPYTFFQSQAIDFTFANNRFSRVNGEMTCSMVLAVIMGLMAINTKAYLKIINHFIWPHT